MKKLITMLAVATAVVVANAASCQWTSGTIKSAASSEGGWSTTTLTSALVTMNVYFIDATTYESLSSATGEALYASYNELTASLTGTNANGVDASGNPKYKGAISISDSNGAEADMYAVIIATYTDANYGDMFIATTGKSVYNEGTQKGSALNLVSNAAAAGSGWQSAAVPEPTSGLLILVGLAGLALRRRRA